MLPSACLIASAPHLTFRDCNPRPIRSLSTLRRRPHDRTTQDSLRLVTSSLGRTGLSPASCSSKFQALPPSLFDQASPGAQDAVAKYMPRPAARPPRPPSQTWGTFIRTHAGGTIAIDFFTMPTVTFGVLYVFFVLSLHRRRVIHVNVTEHPTAEWAAQQIVEAVGPDAGLTRLIRDRDKIFGAAFDRRVDNLGLTQLRTAPRPPWQNGFAERWVGTVRREILDHVIVLGEHHLRRILREYIAYYNADRPHMSLEGDAPMRRDVQPPSMGRVVAMPKLGG